MKEVIKIRSEINEIENSKTALASVAQSKGRQFSRWSQLMPGLQVQAQVRVLQEASD